MLRLTQLWRAYDGQGASGSYVTANPTVTSVKGPLQAPSVFNFFSPFYAPPGEIADRGLVAPELQIATEYQNTLIANFFYQQAFGRNSDRSVGTDPIVHRRRRGARRSPANPAALVARSQQAARGPDVGDAAQTQAARRVARYPASNRRSASPRRCG